jgi:F-type H+-transporting ATPase subunit gamma
VAGAGIKVINKRIRSVKSTQQITRAMKLVSAAKLRRAQDRLLAARPYSGKLGELLQRLADSGDAGHPLFERRTVKSRLFVVIVSNKGLCGAYNMNVIRAAQAEIDASIAAGVETSLYVVGRRANDFFRKRGYTIIEAHDEFGDAASDDKARLMSDTLVRRFLAGEADEVRLAYARFMSALTQRPDVLTCLPIEPIAAAGDDATDGPELDYIWEPGKDVLYAALLPQYLRNRLYITLCESFASEHGARMTSMSAATKNAGEMIDALTLRRNRERQAAITQEINEIVGGANAL